MPAPILLATDGSIDARLAARAAADIARRSGASLHVVHAWARPQLIYEPGAYEWTKTFQTEAAQRLASVVADLKKAGVPVVRQHLRIGRSSRSPERLGPA